MTGSEVAPMFCTQCGKEAQAKDRFCAGCGRQFDPPGSSVLVPQIIEPERIALSNREALDAETDAIIDRLAAVAGPALGAGFLWAIFAASALISFGAATNIYDVSHQLDQAQVETRAGRQRAEQAIASQSAAQRQAVTQAAAQQAERRTIGQALGALVGGLLGHPEVGAFAGGALADQTAQSGTAGGIQARATFNDWTRTPAFSALEGWRSRLWVTGSVSLGIAVLLLGRLFGNAKQIGGWLRRWPASLAGLAAGLAVGTVVFTAFLGPPSLDWDTGSSMCVAYAGSSGSAVRVGRC